MPLKEGSWVIPSNQKKFPWSWKIPSKLTLTAVGLYSKLWIEWLNTVRVHNKQKLQDALDKRRKGQGLITVCNHTSCMDDPLMWGTLKTTQLVKEHGMRWTSAAADICFQRPWHAMFFSFGQCFPLVRGDGVYQKGMDFAVERLNMGSWVHFFPEGKVNMTNDFIRLKWGVGRLIQDSIQTPVVLPMWHVGMDSILPNQKPYIPRIRKCVTLYIGNPMDFAQEVETLKLLKKSPQEIRKHITDRIQEEFKSIKVIAEDLHRELTSSSHRNYSIVVQKPDQTENV